MKFLSKIWILLLCVSLLWLPAAASGVQSAQSNATVSEDGSCYVTIRFQLALEQAQKIKVPLPLNAQNVRLNGSLKTPTVQGDRMILTLSELGAGVHTVEVSFTISNVITEKNGVLNVEVPLLTGVDLPVENFSFTVTFPGELKDQPGFSSGYYGLDIASKLQVQVRGGTVSGSAVQGLLGQETLVLQYKGDYTLFPQFSARQPLLSLWEQVMAALILVGALYYLLALLPSFPHKVRSFSPPEGVAAGDVGTCLTGCGMDLTMMVFSWAQLGYLSIYMDKRNRVWLEKRMEMGSERSEFENRAFQKLFSGRQSVDGGGLHYALLYRKLAKKSPLLRQIYRSRSGNPQIVRGLAVAVGACGGVVLSGGVYTAGAGTVLLGLAMAALCGVLSYFIQSGGRCVSLGNKWPVWLGTLCGGILILAGFLCGNVLLALGLVAYEMLAGIAAAVGGRRSEVGRQYVAQIRGLRTHLTRGSIFDMQQCLEKNPAYFFDLMPYALALGVEKRFARRFGKIKLAECEYLVTEQRNLTPIQWADLLRQVADRLDRRQRRLRYEKILQNRKR